MELRFKLEDPFSTCLLVSKKSHIHAEGLLPSTFRPNFRFRVSVLFLSLSLVLDPNFTNFLSVRRIMFLCFSFVFFFFFLN